MPAAGNREVLSQKEAWDLVGGRPVWEELKKAYPKLLVPLRRKGTKEQFLRELIMTTLRAAQLDGTLR